MEQQLDEIRSRVDRYAELTIQSDEIKKELDQLKGFFEQTAEDDLKDTKNKTVEYYGTSNCKIIVQNAETVKPIAWSVLRTVLGDTFDDFVKYEMKYTPKDTCKVFLNNMVQGNYIEDTLENVVNRMTDNQSKRKTLMKQLKGKYEQDKKKILKHTALSEQEASDYAYLINEVMAYQQIRMVMEASTFKGTIEDAVNRIKSSVIVDETVKVTFASED